MNAMKARTVVLCAILTLVAGCDEKPRILSPDFAVDFGCKSVPDAHVIERFMRVHGFSTFDEESAREKHGPPFFPLQIDGYDAQHVMFDVIGLRQPQSYGSHVLYHLTITGPPPSRHHDGLEKAARELVDKKLSCKIFGYQRHDNGLQSAALFQSVFEDELHRMRGAGS